MFSPLVAIFSILCVSCQSSGHDNDIQVIEIGREDTNEPPSLDLIKPGEKPFPPGSLFELADLVQRNLNDRLTDELMHQRGFVRKDGRRLEGSGYDFGLSESLINEHIDYQFPQHRLNRKIECISTGEGDMTALFDLVAHDIYYDSEEYEKVPALSQINVIVPLTISRKLVLVCEELVDGKPYDGKP